MEKDNNITLLLFKYSLFLLYLVFVIKISFFGAYRHISTFNKDLTFNIVPFSTIKTYLINYKYYGIHNLLGNIILFVPYGIFLYTLFKCTNLKNIIIHGAIASLIVEVLQCLFKRGVLDIDDMFLNILGVIIGYIIVLTAKRFHANLK